MSKEFEASKRMQAYLLGIIQKAQKNETTNKVQIETNLECNVPVKDIHKIAGPFIDEWVCETFRGAQREDEHIKRVVSKESSSLEDIFITLEIEGKMIDILIDVKSASLAKGNNAGKGSNLTSFRKIRPFYVHNPSALFYILSIEHKNLIKDDTCHGFELVGCNIFEMKCIASNELMLNTSMGDQFQISNSMCVTQIDRTTEEFIKLIDDMFADKYGQNKLEQVIAETERQEKIKEVSHVVYAIIEKHEPIKKAEILKRLNEEMKELDEASDWLAKAITLLKKSGIIGIENRRDYVVFKEES